MHELSLMQGIFDSVNKVADEHKALSVSKIELNIGVMTQVVDEALHFAFDVLKEDENLYKDCTLEVNYIEASSQCLQCGQNFKHDQYHLKCPHCGSSTTIVLSGKEMNIASIEIEEEDDKD